MRKKGGERGQENEGEEGEDVGGDRGGEVEVGEEEGEIARQGTGRRGGRIITRAQMGLRLRWMIEGKGPPWAQR